jgi:hypothetical protein
MTSAIEEFLRASGLKVSDVPDELKNPPTFDPKQHRPVRILRIYPGLGYDVKCVFGHVHREGAIVEFDGGHIHLMGNRCAAKEFGEWDVISKNFYTMLDRTVSEGLVGPALERIARLRNHFLKLQPLAAEKDDFFSSLENKFKKFFEKLLDVRGDAGHWRVVSEYEVQKPDGFYRTKTEQKTVGRIVGHHAIVIGIYQDVKQCLRWLDLAEEHYKAQPMTDEHLLEGERYISQVLQRSVRVVPQLQSCSQFFTQAGLATLVKVANDDPEWKKRVSLKGDILTVDATGNFGFKDLKVPFHLSAAAGELDADLQGIQSR